MEDYPNNNNNNNKHLQILAPMPLNVCLPASSDQSSSSSNQNVESSAFSSVTPLKNNRMYDPKMNRLTAIKRLVRNRKKSYPKYGPYPCQWCPSILPTSQSFAGHMRAHYRRIETAARKAAKQTQQQQEEQQEKQQQQQQQRRRQRRQQQQQQQQQQRRQRRQQQQQQQQQQLLMTPEQLQAKKLANAQARAGAQLEKARARAGKLAQILAYLNAKPEAQARPKQRARAPVRAEALTPTPTPALAPVLAAPAPAPAPAPALAAPAPVLTSGSGKQPIRLNDVHLRLSNCWFGQIISPGNKNNSVSTESVSNTMDFLYSRIPKDPNSSSVDVLHNYQHYLQVPPGLASSSMYRPYIDVNTKPPVVVKQELFPDHEDVNPPPGFHHHMLSSEGPHGGRFIIKEERVEFDDNDDVAVYGSLDNLDLKL